MMNQIKGNMYGFINYTWNTICGRCHHNCSYCYNIGRPFFEGELRLNEKNLNDDLGDGNFIFVGSSNDLFQKDVPTDWIIKTLEHCLKFKNKYLFQTKNPERYLKFIHYFKNMDCVLGTTIETDNEELIIKSSKVPLPLERARAMSVLLGIKTMVTIEPIMKFNLNNLTSLISGIEPEWINIGADSKNHKLMEPSKEEIEELIKELEKFTEVKVKPNISRLLN